MKGARLLLVSKCPELIAAALLTAIGAGCVGHAVPMIAAKGTTMMVPLIPVDPIMAVDLGFGSPTGDANGRVDNQRGDLVVGLCPQGQPFCSTPIYLTTRYVTSVAPDPASPASLNGHLAGYFNPSVTAITSQALALVEIPDIPSLTAGTYTLSVRARVHGSAPGTNETALFEEPGDMQIIERPAGIAPSYTPLTSTMNSMFFGTDDVTRDLADLIPYPTVLVRLNDQLEASAANYPAAADLYVSYPATLSIKGVFEDKHPGRRSLVSATDDSSTHTLHIFLLDPHRCTSGVRIAYDWTTSRTTHVASTEFGVVSVTMYDGNGVLIPPVSGAFIMGTASSTGTAVCGS
jgi:hypothetical protein